MLDWLTIKCTHISRQDYDRLHGLHGWRLEVEQNGTVRWQKPCRASIRSDSHQITVYCGLLFDKDAPGGGAGGVELYGSPARVRATHNVFGSGDPLVCAADMIAFANRTLDVSLPQDLRLWLCTRMDVTENYDLGSAAEVRQALSYLRQSEGGRYQVRTASETVYWNAGSSLRSAKAYHKGPHLRYQCCKGQAQATDEEVQAADKLLRLELALRSQFWRERASKPWHQYTEQELTAMHAEYFGHIIGKIEVVEMDTLLRQFEKHAPTPGQALAAYRTWSLIRAVGVREAQASMPKASWFRHRKIMFDAGLTFADLHASNVLPFRRRTIELGRPVRSFAEIRMAA